MQKRKVIFFISEFHGGGGERVLSEVSRHVTSDITSVIVCFEYGGQFPYRGKLRLLTIRSSKNIFAKVRNLISGVLQLRAILKEEKPDYVMSFGNLPNVITLLTTRKAILRVENYISEGNKGWAGFGYLAFVRILFQRAHRIIAVSKMLQFDLIHTFKIPEKKVICIWNPIDVHSIQERAKEPVSREYLDIFRSNAVVIHIGSFVPQKNQDHLLRSFAFARKKCPSLKLIMLGAGELEEKLETLVHELGINEDVYFLGWQKNPFQFLARADVFVLSSLWEGMPMAILEALACGTPVISTDCKSGPREILAPHTDIQHQTEAIEYAEYGVLVPPGDRVFRPADARATKAEELLAEALVEMMTNKQLGDRLKAKSQERAREFDVANVIKNFDALLLR